MKNNFISKLLHCIMSTFENGFEMIYKSKTVKVISFSVLGFCAGLFLTCGVIATRNKVDAHHAVGGYETTVLPEYDDSLTSLLSEAEASLDAPVDAPVQSQSFTEDSSIITYQTYRVKSGDMIGFIADDFNITQDTIISVNNIRQSRLIQPGQYLKIPSMPGIIYTVKKSGETPLSVAEKYDINAEKCAMVNNLSVSSELEAGTSLFVPDAELDWATRQEINGDLFKNPVHVRYWLSSPYGWRDSPFNPGKRTFHGGMDMACSHGIPVYAALDGKVTATGYNATYGNYIIVTHHSGYKTLYAHLSSITCRKGNFVYTNTMIGRVGSTGMSTGPHLHFTVYKNGKTVNPALLLN